jgi:hypothetical protein
MSVVPFSRRHRWGEPIRFERKTERACIHCGIVKVTRHEPGAGFPWVEYWRGLERILLNGTPPCEADGDVDGANAPNGL